VLSGLTPQGANIWRFTVCDSETSRGSYLLVKINDAIRKQETITIKYESPLIIKLWKQKSGYCVTNIEVQTNGDK